MIISQQQQNSFCCKFCLLSLFHKSTIILAEKHYPILFTFNCYGYDISKRLKNRLPYNVFLQRLEILLFEIDV